MTNILTPTEGVTEKEKSLIEKVRERVSFFTSFWAFCTEVLGYRKDESTGYYDLTQTHREVIELLERSKKEFKLILMPRESIKSQIITIGYTLWRLVRNPNLRILIYSDNISKAQGFLSGIKSHIEGKSANSRFRDIFGAWETDPHKGGTFNDSRVVIAPRTHSQKEPSIDTGGIDSSKIGLHYDLIVYDDIVSDINTTTKDQMDKVYDCFKKSLSLLKRGGEVVILGTRWNYGDLYGRLIEEDKVSGEWEIVIKDCEEEIDGKPIFEGIGMTREWMQKQKERQGSFFWSALYRNNPVTDATAIFKIDDFRYYEPHEKIKDNLFITGACDPAGEGEDFTAITVIGTDKDKNLYVLDAVNAHLKPNEIVDHIIRLNYIWGFDRFVMEKNFFKGMLEEELRECVAEHAKNKLFKAFSVTEIMASRQNRTFTRVLALQPYHERKAIKLPGKSFNTLQKVFSDLAYQMIQFTIDGSKSPHNDLLVSLALHTEIIVRGGEVEKEGPAETSAAWFEQKYIETLGNSRIPSKYRQVYQPIFTQ